MMKEARHRREVSRTIRKGKAHAVVGVDEVGGRRVEIEQAEDARLDPDFPRPPFPPRGPRSSENVSPRVAIAAFRSRASSWKRWYTAEKCGKRGSAISGAKRRPFGRTSSPRRGTSASTAGPVGVAAVVARGAPAGAAVAGGDGSSPTTTRVTPAIVESV